MSDAARDVDSEVESDAGPRGRSEAGSMPGGRRAKRTALALGVVGVFTVIAAIATGAVYARSEWALTRRHAIPPQAPALAIEVDPELLDRGRHLVTVVAQCTYCHGPDLAGREMADDPWIGRLHASNLTRGEGGIGDRYDDADWTAALRHGVGPDGRTLLLMPSAGLARLSDRDLAAIVAYVRRVPAVDRALPEKRTGWLTRFVVAAGLAPDLLSAEQVTALAAFETPGDAEQVAWRAGSVDSHREPGPARMPPPTLTSVSEPAPTAAHGEYLVALGGCRVCHRADLAGGLHPLSLPGEPVPPDLTPRGPLGGWSRSEFARAMREGWTPEGRVLDREFMPWPGYAGLEDVEIEAIWEYLESLGGGVDVQVSKPTDLAAGRDVDRSRS